MGINGTVRVRCLGLLLMALPGARVLAADWLELPVVRPVMNCEQLAGLHIDGDELAGATVSTAVVMQTAQGPFCKVVGNIGPGAVVFQVFLPIVRWTQRFAQSAQNTLTIPRAVNNQPAVRGELALAITDKGGPGISRETPWTWDNQQKRIDWAYRANHMTSLVAKALIRTFYGQPQRFAYFIGCSMGGRETLSDMQRYPDDFDGVIAGAPVVIDSVHNAFFPGWEWEANRRADGSIILASSRLAILHAAVLRQCARSAGAMDGVLQHPAACAFDPKWVQCPNGAADTAKCLTAEETRVAQKLYDGPTDSAGRALDGGGFPLGSELYWKLSTVAGPANEATAPGRALVRLLSPADPAVTPAVMDRDFRYDQAWFARMLTMAPLWNTANTNLRPFQKHGGKLILWIGGSDLTVQPPTTIAYYEGVRKELGAKLADDVVRFYQMPGVGHCGGGEGAAQFDLLSPLMAWTELRRAPGMVVAGKTAAPGGEGSANPYSQPAAPTLFTRPVFPYPLVARYNGRGDPNDVTNYRAVPGAAALPRYLPAEIAQFFGPDNQKFYRVENGSLAVDRWTSLFDGRTLDGWTTKIVGFPAGEDPLQTFRAKDGVIYVSYDRYGGKLQSRYAHLFYKEPFKAYRLSLDFRFVGEQLPNDPPAGTPVNSGVMFNSEAPEQMALNQPFPIAIEGQILGANPGGKPRTQGNACGMGIDLFSAEGKLPHCIYSTAEVAPKGTWIHFDLEVTAAGQVTERIDGRVTASFVHSALDATGADKRLPTRELIASRAGRLDLDGGYIGLQSEGHPIEFRNIRILRLE